ncbi:MAG: competence/damage-inducible protein A [Firmicutes bacterium]|nr:competence/damage-inducible protein A [Bacillota bacterium]
MKTAILTVGTEILFGQVVNTNAAYLSKSLQNLGYDVMYHYTVGDNPGRLKELLDFAYHDCDLIITTGGLGPTQDDLTKEIIAEYFGEKLVEYPDQLEILVNHFKNSKYKWTENNRKQAWFPENNCTILANPHGTAPGFMISKNGKHIAALPGPPREMKEMFENQLKPILESHRDSVIYYKIIRTINLGESRMETMLLPLIDGQTDPTIATYAKEGECSLRVTSKRPTYEEAKNACEAMIDKVNDLIGEYIYSYDDEELIDVVGKILIEKNITISAAESCTGGAFAKALTDVPGISKVFERSLVTYNWKAKQEELGVSLETLEKYTAESEEVAREMVDGLKEKTGSDFCIAITGVAGPDDMDEDHPAGLAYIGINYKGETKVIRAWHKTRGRFWNRNFFVLRMLNEVYQLIKC